MAQESPTTPSAELNIPMRFTGPIYELTQLVRKEILKIREGLVDFSQISS